MHLHAFRITSDSSSAFNLNCELGADRMTSELRGRLCKISRPIGDLSHDMVMSVIIARLCSFTFHVLI